MGLEQLPELRSETDGKGYGFVGEGDWKTAALVRAMKIMGQGLEGEMHLWKITLPF